MKPDDFEKKLQRQPLRKIPAAWRAEIVAAATSRTSKVEGRAQDELWLSTLGARLSSVFWPHPKAWTALAAIWIFIFALNFSMRDTSPRIAEKSAPPSPEMIVELKKQQRMFAELMGSRETPDADRQKIFSPKPRSERVEILTA
jgi:hypothetical protein